VCARIDKERGIRRRKLKGLWGPQAALRRVPEARRAIDETRRRTGQGKAAWRLVHIEVDPQIASFSYALNRDKLRKVRRPEGRYLLRSNLYEQQPEKLWKFYIQPRITAVIAKPPDQALS
jgi:hypothetical protein